MLPPRPKPPRPPGEPPRPTPSRPSDELRSAIPPRKRKPKGPPTPAGSPASNLAEAQANRNRAKTAQAQSPY